MIFVSYSHSDADVKDRLVKHLKAVTDATGISVWEDKQIGTGDDWLQEIEKALTGSRAAVLLVSVDFLNSEFIRNSEVPQLLLRRERAGLKIFPLLASPCNWKLYKWLESMQLWPRDARPLSGMDAHSREESLAAFAAEIQKELSTQPTAPRPHTPSAPFDETEHLITSEIDNQLLMLSGRLGTASCSLYVVEPDSNRKYLKIISAYGPGSEKVQGLRHPANKGIAGMSFQGGFPYLTNNLPDEKKFAPGVARKADITPVSMVTVPIRDSKKVVIAVAQFINKLTGQLNEADQQMAEEFADNIGPLIEKLVNRPTDSTLFEGVRECTVIFTDITNYGRVANQAQLQIINKFLSQYLTMACDKALEFGFWIDKFLGDGVMLIGNAPRERSDYAIDAIHLALQIEKVLRDLIEEWQRYGIDLPVGDLKSRIGIATGRVYLSNLGHPQFNPYTAVGPSVNLAWRLLTLGDRDSDCIMICPRSYELTKKYFATERRELGYTDNSTEPGVGYRVSGILNTDN